MERGAEGLPGAGSTTLSRGARTPRHAGCETGLSRRCFLRRGAAAGTWALSVPILRDLGWTGAALEASSGLAAASGQTASPGFRIVRTGCPSHNCGGRCVLKLHVRDGVIVRIETDDRPADTFEAPQLRACARGRAYRRRRAQQEVRVSVSRLHPAEMVTVTISRNGDCHHLG